MKVTQEHALEAVRSRAMDIVRIAELHGLVLTIEQRPLTPLAQGHHLTVVSVRPDTATRRKQEAEQ